MDFLDSTRVSCHAAVWMFVVNRFASNSSWCVVFNGTCKLISRYNSVLKLSQFVVLFTNTAFTCLGIILSFSVKITSQLSEFRLNAFVTSTKCSAYKIIQQIEFFFGDPPICRHSSGIYYETQLFNCCF